jgi:Na+-translocating ferredoxin:NAD+ oxidoreductase RNF subunit RnfB
MVGILTAAGVVGLTGILIGLFLGAAGIRFKVEADEREEAVQSALPGNNCGGCGYAGCSGLAGAIVKGEAPVNACPVGGESAGERIARIMGVAAQATVRRNAYVRCGGDCEKAGSHYRYFGAEDCRVMAFVPGGGPKSCRSGCLGYGTCVESCPFGAIRIRNGVAVVDKGSCKACGKCVEACPRKLIALIPYEAKQVVGCMSTDRGPVTMKACKAGCIGCALCVKACPAGAVKVEEFHAVIDYDKCISCGACQEKCPKKAIVVNW